MVRPTLILHADWGKDPKKRWKAEAVLCGDRYVATAPIRVQDARRLVPEAAQSSGAKRPVLLGFDFPIGLPAAYADRAEVQNFLSALPTFGTGNWQEFFEPAQQAGQIGMHRPFYPQSCRERGTVRQEHLIQGLCLGSRRELFRVCELRHSDRGEASPLFWLVGGKQVGKAALSGWREVLAPALPQAKIWPFAGSLSDLLGSSRVVIAETYPAEIYRHLGLFPARPETRSSKRVKADRQAQAGCLLGKAKDWGIEVAPDLGEQIKDGFGADAYGEDRFDTVVGLFGMLEVVLDHRPAGDPAPGSVQQLVEGWILGQSPFQE